MSNVVRLAAGQAAIARWVLLVVIDPHQSKVIYSIHQPIADASGEPVIEGSYLLEATVGSTPFLVILSLH